MIIFHGERPRAFGAAVTSGARGGEKIRPLLRFPQPVDGGACRGDAVGLASLTDDYLRAAHGFALARTKRAGVGPKI